MHRSREAGRNQIENHLSRPGDFGRYPNYAKGFPMIIVACLTLIFALQDPPAIKNVNDPNALSVEEKVSIQGSIAMMGAGASETMCHPFYIGEKPKLPICDHNGDIHPASCNPSFQFASPKLTKTELNALLPEFKKLRPFGHASHVGVYLPKLLFADRDFINGLQKQLPKCKIYPISLSLIHI